MKQGEAEWVQARLGRATASRIADVVAKTKSGYSASRENYMVQLALERITGRRADSYQSVEMRWGTDQESSARAAYEVRIGALVEEVGSIPHPRIDMSSASPDGLVFADGLVQFKCPNSATHLHTMRKKKPEGGHLIQMMWEMACTGRAWCDYASFDPRMPDGLQLFVVRVPRDDKRIAELEREVEIFLGQVDAMVSELNALKEAMA